MGYVLPNELMNFNPQYFEPLDWSLHIAPLLNAVEANYRSQSKLRPIMFRRDALASKYFSYAFYADEEYVEPFQVLKSVGEK